MAREPYVPITHGFVQNIDTRLIVPRAAVPQEQDEPFVLDAAWDFPPGTEGSKCPQEPPRTFMENLRSLDPGFTVAYQPVLQMYVIWRRKVSDGEWGVIMLCQNPFTMEPLPLDNRIIALLWASDPERFSSVKEFARTIRQEWIEQEIRKHQEMEARVSEMQKEAALFTRIKTGYGRSVGSKSAQASMGEAHIDGNPLEES